MLQRLDILWTSDPSEAPSDADSSTKSNVAAPLLNVVAVYSTLEFLAVVAAAFITPVFYHYFILHSLDWHIAKTYSLFATTLATLVLLFSLAFRNFSAIRRQARDVFLWRGLGAVAISFSTFLTILFFIQTSEQYSRGTLILQLFSVGLTVAILRVIFYSWLQSAFSSNRIEARRIVLIGDASCRSDFFNRLKRSGIHTVGSFGVPQSRRNAKATNGSSSEIRKLSNKIRSLSPDDIVILTERAITSSTLDLASTLAEIPAGVHIVPVQELSSLTSAQIAPFGHLHTIQLYRPPLSAFELFIKRAFDLVFASISLLILSPLFLIVAIAIKLDSRGPIFFRQTRHGFNNEEIRVLKFRSMTCMEDGDQFTQATENDPRVTHIGRIIRRTNIDELPQLINVLSGEMSIVGPRPHATTHNEMFDKVIAPFSRRHNVKPGITGWAQVNGHRGSTDTLGKMQERIEYDLQYIDNWSFLFDMKIIAMTLLTRRAYLNAY